MEPGRIEGHDVEFGKPRNWDDSVNGPCSALPVKFVVNEETGVTYMVSQWNFSEADRTAIAEGANLELWLCSPTHPVVAMAIQGVRE